MHNLISDLVKTIFQFDGSSDWIEKNAEALITQTSDLAISNVISTLGLSYPQEVRQAVMTSPDLKVVKSDIEKIVKNFYEVISRKVEEDKFEKQKPDAQEQILNKWLKNAETDDERKYINSLLEKHKQEKNSGAGNKDILTADECQEIMKLLDKAEEIDKAATVKQKKTTSSKSSCCSCANKNKTNNDLNKEINDAISAFEKWLNIF